MWMDAMLHSARHVMAAEKEGRQVGEAEMVQLFLSHSCPFAGASNRIENKSSLGLRPKSWHDDGNQCWEAGNCAPATDVSLRGLEPWHSHACLSC